MARHKLSVRRKTTVAQRLPKDLEEKTTSFFRYVIKLRKKYSFDLKMIGNADQMPLTFDIASNSTVATKGVKSTPLLTTGHEKDRFTVMLGCLGDGTKLPPYVIFKCKTLPKGMKFPLGVIVRTHPKGWMDENLVEDWLHHVWLRVGTLLNHPSLLVWDSSMDI